MTAYAPFTADLGPLGVLEYWNDEVPVGTPVGSEPLILKEFAFVVSKLAPLSYVAPLLTLTMFDPLLHPLGVPTRDSPVESPNALDAVALYVPSSLGVTPVILSSELAPLVVIRYLPPVVISCSTPCEVNLCHLKELVGNPVKSCARIVTVEPIPTK